MAIWEWIRSGEITKTLAKKYGARSSTEYGTTYRRDQTAPDRSERFEGEGFTWAEVEALISVANTPADQAGGVTTITDYLGDSWTGPITKLSWRPVSKAGTIYWDLSLELDNPT